MLPSLFKVILLLLQVRNDSHLSAQPNFRYCCKQQSFAWRQMHISETRISVGGLVFVHEDICSVKQFVGLGMFSPVDTVRQSY